MKNLSPKQEQELMSMLWDHRLADDPLAFVLAVFPWGKVGTPLERFKGPRKWQVEVLKQMGDHIRKNKRATNPEVFRLAVSSGRGIGKSALVAWAVYWMMSTRLGSATIVTANTEQQLKSRTWAELGKWHAMSLNEHWFERTALSLRPLPWFEAMLKEQLQLDTGYYYAQAQLWSEENPDAFAGAHNMAGIMLIMDESSGIPENIWKVSEGFFTEPICDRYWLTFSNPRTNTGAFFECFHKNRTFWNTRMIDSRSVEGTDIAIYNKIIEQYGEDSDVARVEVKGEFPSQGDKQFIGRGLVDEAMGRVLVPDRTAPLVMGVDVARSGDDESVICLRQGRDARSLPWLTYKRADTVELAGYVMEAAQRWNPDAIFIDGGGSGGGVVDILKSYKYRVIEVQFGSNATDKAQFRRKREEMWSRMRDWLRTGCVSQERRLLDDLTGVQYGYTGTGQLALETKDEMKRRGLGSPDYADALAMTFYQNVARSDMRINQRRRIRVAKGVDYNVI